MFVGKKVKLTLNELSDNISKRLNQGLMNPQNLLSRSRFIDESSRKTSAYSDSNYLPFYYYLGSLVTPKTLIEFGLNLGLTGSCFHKSCHTVETHLALQEPLKDEYYSPRIAKANIKDSFKNKLYVHYGMLSDKCFCDIMDCFVWDIAFINEELSYDTHKLYLETIWSRMELDGLIVMDKINKHEPAKKAFLDFAKIKNRDYSIIKTRYGVGLIQK